MMQRKTSCRSFLSQFINRSTGRKVLGHVYKSCMACRQARLKVEVMTKHFMTCCSRRISVSDCKVKHNLDFISYHYRKVMLEFLLE